MSNSGRTTIAITTLARSQTRFWVEVAERLLAVDSDVLLIAFDDESGALIRARGLALLDVPGTLRRRPELLRATPDAQAQLFTANGIGEVAPLLVHERMAFELSDEAPLRARLAAYLAVIGERLDALRAEGRAVALVQETGGFLSVLAAYHAARARGFDHWAIEPSFFRGRLFFIRNSLAALPVVGPGARSATPEVRDYLEETLRSRAIVVPRKDAHHFRRPWRKVANLGNARRLVEKLVRKYLLGRHYEFGHIGQHVRRHLRMLWSSWRLRDSETPLGALGRFVYYPLHVPADMALTLRAPAYLDQLALIDFVARHLPPGVRLAVKEHPAQQGSIEAGRLKALLTRHPALALLPPATNNFEVLAAAALVISVNSKSGAEALLAGTPTIVLGDAFYRPSGLARRVDSLEALPDALTAMLSDAQAPARESVERYFQEVWDASREGELYDTRPENLERFLAALLDCRDGAARTGTDSRTGTVSGA